MQMCEKYTHICFMYAKSAITKYIGSQWAKSVKCKFYEKIIFFILQAPSGRLSFEKKSAFERNSAALAFQNCTFSIF